MTDMKAGCDAALNGVVAGAPRVPGVVAMVTDRKGDIYSGAAGERRLGGAPMTEDTVFAIFSTTKAIAGTTALQCVEEGLLDLDAPAKEYAPAIGNLQVIEGFDAGGAPQLGPVAVHLALDVMAGDQTVRAQLLGRRQEIGELD